MQLEPHTKQSVLFSFRKIKALGDRALRQLDGEDLVWQPAPCCNSIAVILRHLHGNMLSRWTNFLAEDGEKSWRERDSEFAPVEKMTPAEALLLWEQGWERVFTSLEPLSPGELQRTVMIRGREHTVLEAALRQIEHYSYHTGQLVQLARWRRGDRWETLSIAMGESREYVPRDKR